MNWKLNASVPIVFYIASAMSTFADEDFFYNEVIPKLVDNGCAVCHADDHLTPRIFEYKELLPYLAMGTGPDNNVLVVKMTNRRPQYGAQASHVGGQRCQAITVDPCKTFRQWWMNEFGQSDTASEGTNGELKRSLTGETL